jgi:hypothetical protein
MFLLIQTHLNKVTSPPPSPSPLEGEGWAGLKRIIAFVLILEVKRRD